MKRKVTLLFLVFALIFACSTDSEDSMNDDDQMGMDDDMPAGDLVGLWGLSDIRFDETVDDNDLEFAKDIVGFLIDQECYVVTFDFMDDGTVSSESKANYLANSIDLDQGGGGITVNCPEESDIETTLWMLDGDQLTFTNDQQEEETVTVSFEDEDTFIVDGSAIDENNYDGAEAVFIRIQQ